MKNGNTLKKDESIKIVNPNNIPPFTGEFNTRCIYACKRLVKLNSLKSISVK